MNNEAVKNPKTFRDAFVNLLISYEANLNAYDDDLAETWESFKENYAIVTKLVGSYISEKEGKNE